MRVRVRARDYYCEHVLRGRLPSGFAVMLERTHVDPEAGQRGRGGRDGLVVAVEEQHAASR